MRGYIVTRNDKVFLQAPSGRVSTFDQKTQVIVHDKFAKNDAYFVMDIQEYENSKVRHDIVLYYYNGSEAFSIIDMYNHSDIVKRGDYIDVSPKGLIFKVCNFDKCYEL